MASRDGNDQDSPAAANRGTDPNLSLSELPGVSPVLQQARAAADENLDFDVDHGSDLSWSDDSLSLSSDDSLDDASSLARWAASIIGFDDVTRHNLTLSEVWAEVRLNQRRANQNLEAVNGVRSQASLTHEEIRIIAEEADAAADNWLAGGENSPEHVATASREAAIAATRAAADAYRLGHMNAAAEAESAAISAAGAQSVATAQVAEAILRTRLINGLVPEAALSAAAIAGSLEAARRSNNVEMLRMLGSARYAANAAVRLGVSIDASRFSRRANAFITEMSAARTCRDIFERPGHYQNLLHDAVLGIDSYASDNEDGHADAEAFDPDPSPVSNCSETVPEIIRCFVFESGMFRPGTRTLGTPIWPRRPFTIEITRESLESEAQFDARDREYRRRDIRRLTRQRRAIDRRVYAFMGISERPRNARSRSRRRRRRLRRSAVSGSESTSPRRRRSPPRPHIVVCDTWSRGRNPPTIAVELFDGSGRVILSHRLGGRGCVGANHARRTEMIVQIHGSCFDTPRGVSDLEPSNQWPVAETLRITRTPAPIDDLAAVAMQSTAERNAATNSNNVPETPRRCCRSRSPPAFACYAIPRHRSSIRAILDAALSPAASPGNASAGHPVVQLRLPRPPARAGARGRTRQTQLHNRVSRRSVARRRSRRQRRIEYGSDGRPMSRNSIACKCGRRSRPATPARCFGYVI
ncbi:hypothetical protein [Saltwater crocodilepox virus]|nr:hypothetical protein [Saltwater crocodilepox virus]QGT46660.1 ORF004 [Saltwater crocodilepox virus]QGT47306.1 ORF004 [Saltwater crocodilepox virus]